MERVFIRTVVYLECAIGDLLADYLCKGRVGRSRVDRTVFVSRSAKAEGWGVRTFFSFGVSGDEIWASRGERSGEDRRGDC